MTRGFAKNRFTRFVSNCICIWIRESPWVFLSGQKIQIWLFNFLCLGYPSGIEKTILILILLSHIYFDRPSCADHEYDIFIPIWFSNKKNIIDVPDFELYSIFLRKCVFCWHSCPLKLCFSGFSIIQSVVLYLYLKQYSNMLLDFFH